MKKILYNLFALVLVVTLGMTMSINVAASSYKMGKVYFETCEVLEEEKDIFTDNMAGLAKSISMTLNINSEKIAFGGFYPIRGITDMYYIPVFSGDECICVVTYKLQDDIISLNYSTALADCINNLPSGTYYFEKLNDSIFIVGTEEVYEIETMGHIENNDVAHPTYSPLRSNNVRDIYEKLQYVVIGGQTRDVTTRSLNVPIYPNGGNPGYGYCWLSCCASIIHYYGAIPSSLDNIHAYLHPGHDKENCPGGEITEARKTINRFAGKYGIAVEERITAGMVQTEINAGKPIYSGWGHYNSSGQRIEGHAMVIIGYTYVDNTRAFTYKIMDPNCSDYVYIYSNASAENVTYVISGYTFKWDKTLHNFN